MTRPPQRRNNADETDKKDETDMAARQEAETLPAEVEEAQVPAVPASDMPEGLEDVEASDMTIPRINIDHRGGCFINSQTGERFEEFNAVALGLIKQRTLWPSTPEGDGEGPLCRAVDYQNGIPDLPKWLMKDNGVTAMSVSGFTTEEVQEASEGGSLPCGNCGLKEWDTHPKNSTPWCNEQFTVPVIRILDDGGTQPALISFQRTALKPAKAWISSFAQAKRPLYTVVTKFTAVTTKRGTNEYVIPEFTVMGDSDPTEHPSYSKALHEIREFVTTPRRRGEDEPSQAPAKTAETEPEATAEPTQRAEPEKVEEPIEAEVVADDDEEEPF